jgi:catalase
MPAPAAEYEPAEVEPSPALSQLGQSCPTDGRVIGLLAGPGSSLPDVVAVQQALNGAGMTCLVIAPVGGELEADGVAVTVQRSLATARSV